MTETIKRPQSAPERTVYDGMIKWLDPDCDQVSGEILKDATVLNGAAWGWHQFGLIVQTLSKGNCDVFKVAQNCKVIRPPKLAPFTIDTIWSGFLCDVISGGGLSSKQEREFFEALVNSTGKAFNVTKEEARAVDLRDAGPYEIGIIDHAFSKMTSVNYVSALLDVVPKNPPARLYARDLLSKVFASLK